MEIKKNYYPFGASAQSKTSAAGKEYLSIAVSHSKKKQEKGADGQYADVIEGGKPVWESTWFNLVGPSELLTLSSLCQQLYHAIQDEKAYERAAKYGTGGGAQRRAPSARQDTGPGGMPDDEIPF
ncbi:hypothetical protein FACS1894186_5690 [Alphaproteobacteria bacterium]|nr:hypothetical protein FACS1894186_5690 [Alphaproteobacteria bacterium]